MRYEDSHTGAFQGSGPVANDDLDAVAAGSRSPATGNLITGEGTQTGSAGADSAIGAHITALAGKGGEDTSFSGGVLSVVGEHGKLSVDAEGNYKYQPNTGVENVRDRFTYTLADNQGATDSAFLIVEIGKTPVVIKANATQIVPGPNGVVTLPPGVELADVHVVGRNLVVDMPDGTQLIIIDGAVFVPQLVLGGVEVPATNVAALLVGQEIQPAAGETPPSSGGNFEAPVPPLDPGVPLGDLIPPTDYNYVPPEPLPTENIVDREPTITIQPDGQPASVNAIDIVDEDGLPTRNGGEPAGSDEGADGNPSNNSDPDETTGGVINYDSPDGVDSITINGVVVVSVGQVIAGAYGNLTITSIANGQIGYSYTLADNTSGDNTHDDFSVTITDNDGDHATATLTIDIIDDVPTALNDTDVTDVVTGIATGNVISGADTTSGAAGADTVGADDALLTAISGAGGSDTTADGSGNYTVAGQFGVLTINADGSYTYVLNAGAQGGSVDVFTYTLTDGDGDTDTATLTITNPDHFPTVGENPTVLLDDDALSGGIPGGVGDDPDSANVAGTLSGSGGDGALTFAVQLTGAPAGFTYVSGGAGIVLVQQGGTTVLTVTVGSDGSYTVVQNNPIDHAVGLDENNALFTINYTVTDADGDSAGGHFNINVDDDTPIIGLTDTNLPTLTVDETNLATNATGDFSGNFNGQYGADGPGTTSYAVSVVNGTDSGLVDVATGESIFLFNSGGVVEGRVGGEGGAVAYTVAVDSGTGVVTLDQIRALDHPVNPDPNDPVSPNADSIQLTATIVDHDGDPASLAVNIGDQLVFQDDGPSISASSEQPALTVDETVLATNATASFAGVFTSSFGADGAGTLTYALGISAPGANSGLVDTLTGSAIVLVQNGAVVEGHVGNAAGALAFTVSVDASGNVTLDQIRAVIHPTASNPDTSEGVTLSADNLVTLTATITDKDGDPQSATANIGQNLVFQDDGPSAINDSDTIAAGGTTATGNVITGIGTDGGVATADNAGADQPGHITAIQGAGGTDTTFSAGVLSIAGAYGTLDIDANGNYTYTRDPGAPGTVQDVFTYTLTDADGDFTTATLTINISDSAPNLPDPAAVLLDDDALAGGNPGGTGDDVDSSGTPGQLVGSGGDGDLDYFFTGTNTLPAGFSVNVVNAGQIQILQGATVVLTVTLNNEDGSFNVVQNNPIDHPAGLNENNLSFLVGVEVQDADGDSEPATITINVDDDTPTVSANAAVQLDDDALAGGNPGGTGDDANATNTSGTLAHSYGADGAGSVAYLNTGAPVGFSYALQGNGDLWVLQGVTHVLTLTVNATTGAYSVSQVAPIDHAAGGDENNVAFTVSYQVTDHDGDSATGSIVVNVDDDTPISAIVTTGQHVSVDESVGIQVDSNDTTNAGVISLFSGVANKGVDTDLPQYATNASAIVASTGSSYGADGAGTTVFSLNVSSAGVDSGLNTTDGQDIFLYKEGNLIVGRVGSQSGAAAFALAIDPATGQVSMVEYLSIQHHNAANADDSVSIANGAVQATVTVTDHDGDVASTSTNIGSLIQFQDSGPIMTSASNINIQNSGDVAHSGAFAFNLGADGAPTSNDVISIGASSATVNGVAVTNYVLTPGVENATTASYSFSFDYPNGTGTTAHETGTLVFDKVAGTYTVDLADPISGFSILATAGAPASAFVNYDLGTSNTSNSPTEVAVVQLDTNFFLQFSGVYDKTGSDHQTTTNGGGYAPVTSATFGNLDLFSQANATVTVSSSAAGVAGNTIQGGEVLDFNLYATDQHGTLGATPTQSATSMFIELDGVGGSEDMIVILKLYDTVTHQYTEVALMVQNGDIITNDATLTGTPYDSIVLDSNDGLIVIEANDYQNGNTNLVIVGAQIAGSDDGVTGTAENFNGTFGAGGGWDGTTQAFTTDVSDAPFKIQNIGFLRTTTTDQTAHLSFDVTIHDGDGDTVTQTITADVTNSVDSSTPISLSAAVTTIVPVAIDLDGDGVQFLAHNAGVHYDYNGDGVKEATAWVGPQDGILVHDANGNGTVDGASEFVFGGNGQTDLQALAAQYGATLDANDADYTKFGVWQDANSNGVVDAGEYSTLANAGIASISLVSDGQAYSAAGGDVEVAGSATYTNTDGSTGTVADASFSTGAKAVEEKQALNSSSSNIALAAAVAAAGLAGAQAAAAPVHGHDGKDHQDVDSASSHGHQVAAIASANADTSHSALSNETKEAANDSAPVASSSHGSDAPADSDHALDNSSANAAAASSDHPAAHDQGPASSSLAANPVAPSVGVPSAEALQAAGLTGGHAQHGGLVAQVVAEALGHGNAPATVDALLNALPGGNGHAAANANVASPAAEAVSGWDMSAHGTFGHAADMMMKMGAQMLHHDAVQPAHNG